MIEHLRRGIRLVRSTVTPVGWSVVALVVLAWYLAARYGWEELAWFAAGGTVVMLIAVAFTLGSSTVRGELSVVPERLTAGETATGGLSARSGSGKRLLPLRIEVPVGKAVARFDLPSLSADADHSEPFVIPTTRRSVVTIGPASVVRGDALGLLRREVPIAEPVELFVHPRTVHLTTMSTGMIRDLEGETTTDRSPSDVAFHTLREYVPGDDRRHIHWRTTARHPEGKLMVREFVDTRRSLLALVLSTAAADYAHPDEFELAVSVVASVGGRAIVEGQQVSCMTSRGEVLAFSRSKLFDELARLELRDGDADLQHAAWRAVEHTGGASVVVLACGSTVDVALLRSVSARFGSNARVIAARGVTDAPSGVRSVGQANLIDVADLDDLPRLMWGVVHA